MQKVEEQELNGISSTMLRREIRRFIERRMRSKEVSLFYVASAIYSRTLITLQKFIVANPYKLHLLRIEIISYINIMHAFVR